MIKKINLISKFNFFFIIYASYLINFFIHFSEEKEIKSKPSTPEIDDEGYRIQPSGQWSVDKGSFYSTSDSGS